MSIHTGFMLCIFKWNRNGSFTFCHIRWMEIYGDVDSMPMSHIAPTLPYASSMLVLKSIWGQGIARLEHGVIYIMCMYYSNTYILIGQGFHRLGVVDLVRIYFSPRFLWTTTQLVALHWCCLLAKSRRRTLPFICIVDLLIQTGTVCWGRFVRAIFGVSCRKATRRRDMPISDFTLCEKMIVNDE